MLRLFAIYVVIKIYADIAKTPFEIVIVSILILTYLRVSVFEASWWSRKVAGEEEVAPRMDQLRRNMELMEIVTGVIVFVIVRLESGDHLTRELRESRPE